jgi:hypothetical protein
MPKGLYRRQNTGDLHFITISCHRHAHILKPSEACNTLQKILEESRRKYLFHILGYVFMSNYSMTLLPIRYGHILQLEALPAHHSDPFDRLLIAQAIAESLPILTHDEKFSHYPVKSIW